MTELNSLESVAVLGSWTIFKSLKSISSCPIWGTSGQLYVKDALRTEVTSTEVFLFVH